MLDGLLGRGFAFKCKSLIKLTVTRIDAIKRRRNAAQTFLKKDIADLLASGLDVNAYKRAEGFLAELGISSCYDFILQLCECILSHLSVMEKQRECPEECREAVSTLMFAAARFSDLPELRELRHIFQDRYGSSVEHFVNQEFVAKSASKPPSLENKIKLIQEIASEFTIDWDCRGFEQRISKSSATPTAVNKLSTNGSPLSNEYKSLNGKESFARPRKHDAYFDVSKRDEDPLVYGGHIIKHKPPTSRKPTVPKAEKRDIPVQPRHEFSDEQHESLNGEEQSVAKAERSGSSSYGKRPEYIDGKYIGFHCNGASLDPSTHIGSCDYSSKLGEVQIGPDHSAFDRQGFGHPRSKDDEEYHNQDYMKPIPKQRVSRRRHSKSLSSQDDNDAVCGTTVGKRSSRSRRDQPQGLQILIDDAKGHHPKDEEDRLLDNMLVHLSKKTSSFDPEKVRHKLKADPKYHKIRDSCEIPQHNRSRSWHNANAEMLPLRSAPLLHEEVADKDSPKAIARATSLQDKKSNPAHVHPKLPNYDDLAARFASLKGK